MEATNTPDEFGWLLEVNHFGEWRKQMRSYSLLTNTVLKISGFAAADAATLGAYVHATDAMFSVHRLVMGSNTQFCPNAYGAATRLLFDACADQSAAWQNAVFRETARLIYTINGVS